MGFVAWVTFALWGINALVVLVGTLLVRYHFRTRRPAQDAPRSWPPVSVLKPLKGLDENLEENLASFFELDYPNYELHFCVASDNDAAIPVVEALMAKYPDVTARLHVGDVDAGPNPKINNLWNAYDEASHDLVLVADSNVRADAKYLKRFVRPILADETVGVVTGVTSGRGSYDAAGLMEAAYQHTFIARWLCVASSLGVPMVMGKSMLFRRSVARQFGGLEALAPFIAEDFWLGRHMKALGLRVALVSKPIHHHLGRYDFATFWKRHVRWGRIRKVQAPVAFLLEPFTGVFFSSLTGAFAAQELFGVSAEEFFLASFLGWLIADLLQMKIIGKQGLDDALLGWLLREIVALPLWAAAVVGSTVHWRGTRLRIHAGGRVSMPRRARAKAPLSTIPPVAQPLKPLDLFFVKLCWKNIWRNRRRTLITVNAIGVGVMSLVAIHNYYDAFHEQVIHNVIRYHSGHLLVSAPGYLANNSPGRYLHDGHAITSWLDHDDAIKAYSPRVLVQGMLSSPAGSANLLFTGVDPKRERQVTRFAKNIIRGTYLGRRTPNGIVIGRKLARLLKVGLGSKVVALTQGVDGSIGNELFFVSGIFETQSDLDKSVAFIGLEGARKLLSLPRGGLHQIAVVLKSESELAATKEALRAAVPARKAEILTWMEIQRPLMAMIELNKSANRLLMIIILFIAAMGIANSILMSILERTREFGVMLAMGTQRSEVTRMVILETLMLSAVGVAVGNIFGISVTLYFNYAGFDLRWLTSQSIVVEGTIIQTISYPTVIWENSAIVTGAILFLSLLVSYFPVRHVAALDPVKALRAH